MDEESGKSSRLIDLSIGGFTIIMGNILMQGNSAENRNLVGYGLEGLTNENYELYFINNICINKRQASGQFLDIATGTPTVNVPNNIFSGIGEVINVANAELSNNIIDTSIDNMLFIDEEQYNCRFAPNAPAIDNGIQLGSINGYSLTPENVYVHPTYFAQRVIGGAINAGAYETQTSTSNSELAAGDFIVYPNPFQEVLTIKSSVVQLTDIIITDHLGREFSFIISITIDKAYATINTGALPSGVYIIQVGKIQKKVI